MASVVIAMDTETRESVLTIDGELISTNSMWFSKGIDFDGEPFLNFRYMVETKNENGLVEIKEFFLKNPSDDVIAKVLESGLCCRETKGLTKAQLDIVKFMNKK